MRYFLLALLLAFPAHAQWKTVPSTPDISVSAASTADFAFPPKVHIDWVAIKNDCSDTLYFGLAPPQISRTALDYPIRLEPGESYSVEAYITSVGASNDNTAACTFTLQGRYR